METESVQSLKDYWLSLLYKKLVGTIVLNARFTDVGEKRIRVYLHCTNINNSKYTVGDVTLFALNLYNYTQKVQLPSFLSDKFVDEYILLPGAGGLHSTMVLLNGQLLKMVDDKTLPALNGKQLDPGSPLVLPPSSFGFYVVKNAKAIACL